MPQYFYCLHVQREERPLTLENAVAFTMILQNHANKVPKNI